MNIYLACTVRGDRGGLEAARALADLLERHGHTVVTRHLLDDDVEAVESALTERDVFERDMKWLNASDLLVAEASGSSYGVGFEVGYVLGRAERSGQRVLVLYHAGRQPFVSRLIAGNAHEACTDVSLSGRGRPASFRGHLPRAGRTLMRAVRIRRLRADVTLPKYESAAAAGFDLAAADDVMIAPGEVRLVPTGLVIEVPEGMFLGIFARSSTPLKRGLMVANGVGVIDADYCGPADEVKVQVLNFTPSPVTIKAGERIAQGLLLPITRVEWNEVDTIDRETRGGFGSTG